MEPGRGTVDVIEPQAVSNPSSMSLCRACALFLRYLFDPIRGGRHIIREQAIRPDRIFLLFTFSLRLKHIGKKEYIYYTVWVVFSLSPVFGGGAPFQPYVLERSQWCALLEGGQGSRVVVGLEECHHLQASLL